MIWYVDTKNMKSRCREERFIDISFELRHVASFYGGGISPGYNVAIYVAIIAEANELQGGSNISQLTFSKRNSTLRLQQVMPLQRLQRA